VSDLGGSRLACLGAQGKQAFRLEVVVMPARKMNASALQFLILATNKEQALFQFEFYNLHPAADPFLELLNTGRQWPVPPTAPAPDADHHM
jgi:hypothetical protein